MFRLVPPGRGSNRAGGRKSWNGLRRCGANWRQLVGKTHGGHVFKREAGGVKIKEKPSQGSFKITYLGGIKQSGQFITTSAEVTPNGGLVRESSPKWP